jgi:hypothetical protein
MGGAVAVTVRFSEEEQYRMTWGTGGLNLFKRPGFLMQDPQFFDACRARWVDPELAGSLAPTDYGLVLVDFVTKRIISFQNFTSIDSVHLIHTRIDKEMLDEMSQLATNGFIKQVVTWKREGRESTRSLVPLSEYGDVPAVAVIKAQAIFDADFNRQSHRDEESVDGAFIPHQLLLSSEFSVLADTTFPHTMDWNMVRKAVVDEMGFKLTQDEEKSWDAWIADMTEAAKD